MTSLFHDAREPEVAACAERAARAAGCEVIELSLKPRGRGMTVAVTVDRPGGVTVEDCAQVSRALSGELERRQLLEDAYTLEVSSPGADRPLRGAADYDRFRGRLALIHLLRPMDGRDPLRGRLLGRDQAGRVLLEIGPETAPLAIALDEIRSARLELDLPEPQERRRKGRP